MLQRDTGNLHGLMVWWEKQMIVIGDLNCQSFPACETVVTAHRCAVMLNEKLAIFVSHNRGGRLAFIEESHTLCI